LGKREAIKKNYQSERISIALQGADIKKGQSAEAPCPFQKLKNLLHQFRTDVFDDIPDIFVLKSFLSHHAGSLGTVLDDKEHLARSNVFHGFRTFKVAGFRFQSRTQFPATVAFVAMTHFAGHGFGSLDIDFFACGGIGTGSVILFVQAGGSFFGFPFLRTFGSSSENGVNREQSQNNKN
jgi:hypothetical protein